MPDAIPDTKTAEIRLWARWAGLVVLLWVEVSVLTPRFSTEAFVGDERWWAVLLRQSRFLPALGLQVAIATLLLGGSRLRDLLCGMAGQIEQRHRSWPFFLGHLAAYAGFARLTVLVLEGDIRSSLYPGGWVIAWATLGLATLALWGAIALPISLWMPLARRGAGAWLVGVTVGSVAWGAGRFTGGLWRPLGRSTLWGVHTLLGLVCRDAICQPADLTVGTSSFAVVIWPSCSGYQGIGLIVIFLAVYLWVFRHSFRFPRALLLLPLGMALIWLANAVRIAALVLVGTWISPDVAMGGFHTQTGGLASIIVGLGLIAIARHTRFFSQADSLPGAARGSNPTAAYLTPLLAIVATAMITGAVCSSAVDPFYPLRILAAAGALWFFRRDYAELRGTWSWQAIAIGGGAFALWMALEPTPTGTAARTAGAMGWTGLPPGWAEAWLISRVIGSVVMVPLAEELAFRGYLTRRLIASEFQDVPVGRFSWLSFLISSALFGMLHRRWLAGTMAGMFYALALYRRGKLSDAVLAHATTNILIAAYVLTTGAWWLWV
jgi:exosortase E/protease (VPEID-CTERM system)